MKAIGSNLLIKNIGQLATPTGGRHGWEVTILSGAAVIAQDGKIVAMGTEAEVLKGWDGAQGEVIDARGGVVLPGFVDCHTHPVFLNTREGEFALRCAGKTYQEIARAGGGIRASVRSLREASKEELIKAVLPRLDRFLKLGTTTIEAKSGYGLSLQDEIKSLEVIKELNKMHPIDMIPTFLGAHEVPDEYRKDRRRYIDLLKNEMIPKVAEEGLASACDVFCEEGVFSVAEAREILTAAKGYGLKLKVHADQLSPTGGAELAAELGCLSADHLEFISDSGIRKMGEAGVVGVLLPGATFFLGMKSYPPARRMMEGGMVLALATDFNPGSSPTQSLPLMMTLSGITMGLSPEETLIATTLNAARAIDKVDQIGRIEVGKQADLVIYSAANYKQIPYFYGLNLVNTVIKKGKVIFRKNR